MTAACERSFPLTFHSARQINLIHTFRAIFDRDMLIHLIKTAYWSGYSEKEISDALHMTRPDKTPCTSCELLKPKEKTVTDPLADVVKAYEAVLDADDVYLNARSAALKGSNSHKISEAVNAMVKERGERKRAEKAEVEAPVEPVKEEPKSWEYIANSFAHYQTMKRDSTKYVNQIVAQAREAGYSNAEISNLLNNGQTSVHNYPKLISKLKTKRANLTMAQQAFARQMDKCRAAGMTNETIERELGE